MSDNLDYESEHKFIKDVARMRCWNRLRALSTFSERSPHILPGNVLVDSVESILASKTEAAVAVTRVGESLREGAGTECSLLSKPDDVLIPVLRSAIRRLADRPDGRQEAMRILCLCRFEVLPRV